MIVESRCDGGTGKGEKTNERWLLDVPEEVLSPEVEPSR